MAPQDSTESDDCRIAFTRRAMNWLFRQPPETVILSVILLGVLSCVGLSVAAVFHQIPGQIDRITEAHQRAIDAVNLSHEKRSLEDKQIINRLMDQLAGVNRRQDPRNVAGH